MGATEYLLLILVIAVPLAVAAAVTLWSLKQVQYRPKKRRPSRSARPSERGSNGAGDSSEPASS